MGNTASFSAQGLRYDFEVLSYDGAWNPVGGIYMFARQELNGSWTALYIGKCTSFKDRMCGHEQWEAAKRHGATAVLAKVVPDEKTRSTFEEMLIRQIQPILNTHFRMPTLADALGLRPR